MKELLLLNPRSRSRKRRLKSSRRTRKNPTILGFKFGGKKRKARKKKRTSLFSKKRRKAVKSFFTKKRTSLFSGLVKRKRRTRSRKALSTSKNLLANPMRKSHRRRHHRHHGRRLSLRGPRRMRMNPVDIKALFSPTNLGIAGGVVAGTQVTSFVLNNFGANLPGVTSQYGMIFYRFAIPAAFGVGLTKYSKSAVIEAVGLGFVIAGLVNAGGSLISMFTTPQPAMVAATPATPAGPAATGAYLGAYLGGRRPGVNAYLSPRTMGEMPRIVRNLPVAMNGAFKNDAWNLN